MAMLANHPRLAIAGESSWITELGPDGTIEEIVNDPSWHRFPSFDPDAARALAAERRARSWPALVDAVYTSYARAIGRPRWGEKTPEHLAHLERLAGWFPNGRFINVIRDGREVAASLKALRWGPRTATAGALRWERELRAGRRAGLRLGPERYAELRLEDLVADPERELRRICAFLGEDYAPEMLDYPRRIAAAGVVPPAHHPHLARPPTANLRDPRAGLTPLDWRAVEAVCRPLLAELDYPVADSGRASIGARALIAAADVAVRTRDLVRRSLPPRSRRR